MNRVVCGNYTLGNARIVIQTSVTFQTQSLPVHPCRCSFVVVNVQLTDSGMCTKSYNWRDKEPVAHERAELFTVSVIFISIAIGTATLMTVNFFLNSCGLTHPIINGIVGVLGSVGVVSLVCFACPGSFLHLLYFPQSIGIIYFPAAAPAAFRRDSVCHTMAQFATQNNGLCGQFIGHQGNIAVLDGYTVETWWGAAGKFVR